MNFKHFYFSKTFFFDIYYFLFSIYIYILFKTIFIILYLFTKYKKYISYLSFTNILFIINPIISAN